MCRQHATSCVRSRRCIVARAWLASLSAIDMSALPVARTSAAHWLAHLQRVVGQALLAELEEDEKRKAAEAQAKKAKKERRQDTKKKGTPGMPSLPLPCMCLQKTQAETACEGGG